MDFVKYLKDVKAQKKIDKIAKKYKGKKIAVYGAGGFSDILFSNYDLSGLNIVAIADKKFEDPEKKCFHSLNCITPQELTTFDCDIILISNYDFMYFWDYLENDLLRKTKNAYVTVKPIIQISYLAYLKMLLTHKF